MDHVEWRHPRIAGLIAEFPEVELRWRNLIGQLRGVARRSVLPSAYRAARSKFLTSYPVFGKDLELAESDCARNAPFLLNAVRDVEESAPPRLAHRTAQGQVPRATPELVAKLIEAGVPPNLARRLSRSKALATLAALKAKRPKPKHQPIVLPSATAATKRKRKKRRPKRPLFNSRIASEAEARAIKRKMTGPYDNARHHP